MSEKSKLFYARLVFVCAQIVKYLLCVIHYAIFVAYFRQSFLQEGFGATMLCMAVALPLYEIVVFIASFLTGITTLSRFILPLITAALNLLACPILYPVVRAIRTIGGETWKE